jgi:hypothetical protein
VSAAAWVAAMIMPGSDSRHEDVYAFIPLLISALGLASVPQIIREIRRNSRGVARPGELHTPV